MGVVEEGTPLVDEGRGRIEELEPTDLSTARAVDDRDGRLESIQDVDVLARRVHRDPGRSGPDVQPVDASQRRIEHQDVVRPHPGHPDLLPVGGTGDAPRIADAEDALGEGDRRPGVVEVGIEIATGHPASRAGGDDRSLHRDESPGEVRFEPHLVGRLGSHDDHPAIGTGGRGHVGGQQVRVVRGGQRRRIDDRHAVAVEIPGHRIRPVTRIVVQPAAVLGASHDDRDVRGRRQRGIHRRIESATGVRGRTLVARVRVHAGGDGLLRQDRRPVPRLEDHRVHVRAVEAERPRILAVDRDGDRRGCGIGRVEHHQAVLLGDADEGPGRRPGEDHVRRLVAGREGRRDRRGVEVDDRHRVAQVVDDPRGPIVERAHAHRLEADRDAAGAADRAVVRSVEDLESIVGRVRHEDPGPVGRHLDGVDLGGLEVDERLGVAGRSDRRRKAGRRQE